MASGKTLAGRAGCIFQIAFRMCLVTQTEGKGVASRVVRVVRNRLPGREMQETQTRRSDPCFGETPWRRAWHPLQCSCLESPVDGGACWAAGHGVAQSRTRLKRLSSSSSSRLDSILDFRFRTLSGKTADLDKVDILMIIIK